MMRTIASYNIKGGTGKTCAAVNLAYAAAAEGNRTLLWDLDEQGAASTILGHQLETRFGHARRTYRLDEHVAPSAWDGVDLLPADKLVHLLDRHDRSNHLRKLLERVSDRYDVVVLDCPPTLGQFAELVLEAADLVVVPVIPSALAMNAYAQLVAYRDGRSGAKPELMPVFTMVDRRRRLHREALDANPERRVIPYSSVVEQMTAQRLPLAVGAPGSPAVKAFSALWGDVAASFER